MQSDLPPFSCTHTPEMSELLAQLGISLLVSTYQAGKVIAISADGEKLIQRRRESLQWRGCGRQCRAAIR